MTARVPTGGGIAQWFKQMTIVRVVREIVKRSLSDDILGLAAEFAYNAIFAIPAFLIFLVALAAVANQVTGIPIADQLRHLINQGAPEGTKALLDQLVGDAIEINAGAASLGAVIAIIAALWSGSSVIKTLIKAFNRAYDVKETRRLIHLRFTSIVLTVFSAVLIITSFVLFVFGEWIGVWLADAFRLGVDFAEFWGLLRWPLAVIMVSLLMVVIYLVGPNVKGSMGLIALGSAVATVLWVAAVLGFQFYLMVANPGGPYGVAGSVLVLLVFLYITGVIFMFGGEINAVLYRHQLSRAAAATGAPQPSGAGEEFADTRRFTWRLRHRERMLESGRAVNTGPDDPPGHP